MKKNVTELRLDPEIEDFLADTLSEIGKAFALEGEWSEKYGTQVGNDVFSMHPYSWDESQDDPWSAACDCEISAQAGREEREPCQECPARRFADQNYILGHGAPNFYYKVKGIHVTWYKYIGRGMSVLSIDSDVTDLTRADIEAMKEACLAALDTTTMQKRALADKIDQALHDRPEKDELVRILSLLRPAGDDEEKTAAFESLCGILAEDARTGAQMRYAEQRLDEVGITKTCLMGFAELTTGGRVDDIAVRYRLMLRALASTRRALAVEKIDREKLLGSLDTALFAIAFEGIADDRHFLEHYLPDTAAFAERAESMTREDLLAIVEDIKARGKAKVDAIDRAVDASCFPSDA